MTKGEFAELLQLLQQKIALMDHRPVEDMVHKLWQKRISDGEPALSKEDFPVKVAAKLLMEVLLHQKQHWTLQQLEQLVLRYVEQHSLEADWKQAEVLPEDGAMYMHLACKFALEELGKQVTRSVSIESWNKNVCPVCGDHAAFACFEKPEGRRVLVCGACLTHWRYKRIGCTFCEEENPEKLKRVTADEFPGWSATVCKTCKGYLKAADLRIQAAKPNWYEAVVDTLPLDYAITHGEVSKWNS